jgi:hypothetical protein
MTARAAGRSGYLPVDDDASVVVAVESVAAVERSVLAPALPAPTSTTTMSVPVP